VADRDEGATQPDDLVRVSLRIPAPAHLVFEAWLDPDIRRLWWRPAGPQTQCQVCEVEARIGGTFRTVSTSPGKSDGCRNVGEFLEIVRPELLRFTWTSEDPADGVKDTLVTVTFHAVGDETEVTVIHHKLPDPAQREGHGHGWGNLLALLAATLTPGHRPLSG
jgi:uncharacterized protein YndB with AHSA1/START domain